MTYQDKALAVNGFSVYPAGEFGNRVRRWALRQGVPAPRTGDRGVCLDGSDARIKLARSMRATGFSS